MDEEEIKIKMDDGVAMFFTRFGGHFVFVFLPPPQESSALSQSEAVFVE